MRHRDPAIESTVVLALAVIGSVVLLLALSSDLTFYQDTWAFLMHRGEFSADALLQPHNEHVVVIPVAIEQLLVNVFGMTSALPEYVLMTAVLATTAVLLFVYVRRRLGPWPATMAAALLLFLGPAWEVLLWPFEIGFAGSIMVGIGALLALEREDRLGDRVACLLLAIAVGFSNLGLTFVVAAAVDVLQRRRTRGLGRAYVVAVPLLLFAAWYAGWGHTAESQVTLRNVLTSPKYLLEGLGSSLETMLGLSRFSVAGIEEPGWGWLLLVAAVALIVVGWLRRPGFSPRLWPVAAATATFWLLTAFNYTPGREASTSRYAYAGAVFLVLTAAELLRGVRFGRRSLWVGRAIVLAAVASNLVSLVDGRDGLEEQSVLARADTGAIDIARRTVDPSFTLIPPIAGTPSLIDVNAAEYLPAVSEHGSPGYSPAELEDAPSAGRRQADIVLAQALPLRTDTYLGSYNPDGAGENCVVVGSGGGGGADIPISPGVTRIELAPGPHADFSLRRFAVGEYPVSTEGAPGNSMTLLRIPRDGASQPWHLKVDARQRALVCR
ncbi:MAG: hypothetical protein WBL45_12520 [Solirubrobacterales bacterium]